VGLASGRPELRMRGHEPVAVDLPCEQESAGWWAYAGAVVDAVAERRDVIVVGHSLGGFTAPLICARIPADLLILLSGMIPSPGELFDDWWKNAGYEQSGLDDVFYHDVPPQLAAEAQRRERNEDSNALREPWPLDSWPAPPTRYLLCRDDRMFTAAWARRHARARLGIDADEMDGGHYVTLSRPRELAERLHAYAEPRVIELLFAAPTSVRSRASISVARPRRLLHSPGRSSAGAARRPELQGRRDQRADLGGRGRARPGRSSMRARPVAASPATPTLY
jgi:Alpha/beta hydrolase family